MISERELLFDAEDMDSAGIETDVQYAQNTTKLQFVSGYFVIF